MLINIGFPAAETGDVVDLLLACHERIRFFIDLAIRIGDTADASNEEIRDAAARIVRYFSESLPLHVADEEESIIPRLSGRDAALDRTFESIRREHSAHDHDLKSLLKICGDLQAAREPAAETRQELRDIAVNLRQQFQIHLSEEEQVVLPAIRSLLTDHDRKTMLQEFRSRIIWAAMIAIPLRFCS